MTATEALIRAQEKGCSLAPTMGRQQSRGLGPQIEREIDLLMFHRIPAPDAARTGGGRGEYEIVYDSPMSRMQRAEELVGVQRPWNSAPFAQIDPSVLDVFDRDALARLTAEVSGCPDSGAAQSGYVNAIRRQRHSRSRDGRQCRPQRNPLPAPEGLHRRTNCQGRMNLNPLTLIRRRAYRAAFDNPRPQGFWPTFDRFCRASVPGGQTTSTPRTYSRRAQGCFFASPR